METHLDGPDINNRKNGYTKKTVKSLSGSFELETQRDRDRSFEPQLIKKHQTHLTDEIETKIISMFGLGMSYRDIATHIADMYDLDVSNALISSITNKLVVSCTKCNTPSNLYGNV